MHGIGLDTNIHSVDILSFFAPPDFRSCLYGVVPKGLLALPGSLYKEVAKTTSGTLCVSLRETNRQNKKSSFEKHCILDLECRILSKEPSDSCILYFKVIFHGK